jgi:hypothetical protein
VQAALHQEFAFCLVNQFDGLCGRRFAVRRVNDPETTDVEIVLARDAADLAGRPDQDWLDDARLGSLRGPAQ